jgi:hypothetical protein
VLELITLALAALLLAAPAHEVFTPEASMSDPKPAAPLGPTEQFYALVNFRGASSLALKCVEDAAESAAALAAGHDEAEVRALFARLLPMLRRATADLEEARVLTQPVVARAYAKGG